MDFLQLCKKIVRIDSTPSAGNEEIARFCATLCQEAGLQAVLQEGYLKPKAQYNLLARPKGKNNFTEEVIFQSHLDTVAPGPMGHWTKTDNNAFEATIDGDRIYGLGTADVKLDFLCKLRALKEFANTKMKKPFVLVGTFGEEIGMLGAHHLMNSKSVKAKMAIIGEPSELQIVYANNGFLVMEFDIPFSAEEVLFRKKHSEHFPSTTQEKIFHGRAAHSSTPHLGDNAILKMVDYLSKLPDGIAVWSAHGGSSINTVPPDAHVEVDATEVFISSVGSRLIKITKELTKLEKELAKFQNPTFSPPSPTVNIATLRTEERGLTLGVSARLTPDVTEADVEGWVSRLKDYINALGGDCRVIRMSSPALTPLDSPLVKGAVEISQAMGLSEKPITKASGTESSVYRRYGIDCIVFGPGISIGNSHTANEYNLISHLEKATEFYSNAVKRFCL